METEMRTVTFRTPLLTLVVLSATACATSGTQSSQRARAALPGTEACLWLHNIEGWDVIDPSTMIVYAPLAKDAYLVKLFEPVYDLNFHERIGFDDGNHDGRICSLGDDVVVRGAVPQQVPITAVRALTPDQVKRLKATANGGKAAPAPSSPAAGQPVPGTH
jgi:hypothetical protein